MNTKTFRCSQRSGKSLAALGLIVASIAGCSGVSDDAGLVSDEEGEGAPEMGRLEQALTNVVIVSKIERTGGIAMPGVEVVLSGNSERRAVSDANGMVRFSVPAGRYSLKPAQRAGRTFAPDVLNFSASTDNFTTFRCSGAGCTSSTVVNAAKSVLITDPTVVGSDLASNASNGPFSFRHMIEEMAPPDADPADFVLDWIGQFSDVTELNGFPVSQRDTTAWIDGWPKDEAGRLDLAQAPFELFAIVNRTDLHANAPGELRFVYGLVLGEFEQSMTVIFEYALPTRDMNTGANLNRKSWVNKFQALGSLGFGPAYNAQLQALTDLVTRRGASPSRPQGSAIGQVRSNEIVLGSPWQMREFHLSDAGALRLVGPGMTPADTHMQQDTPEHLELAAYINANAVSIRGGFDEVPGSMLGGESNEEGAWAFSVPVDEPARVSFAGKTCNGCHSIETSGLQLGGFYHIAPGVDPGSDGTGRLSPFVKTLEIPRRTAFMQNQLTCTGAACAVGAEALLF